MPIIPVYFCCEPSDASFPYSNFSSVSHQRTAAARCVDRHPRPLPTPVLTLLSRPPLKQNQLVNRPLSPLHQQLSLMALPFSLLLPIHSLCNPEQVSLMACPFSLLLSIHSFCNLEQVGRMEVFFVLTQDAMLIMCLLVDLLHILFKSAYQQTIWASIVTFTSLAFKSHSHRSVR